MRATCTARQGHAPLSANRAQAPLSTSCATTVALGAARRRGRRRPLAPRAVAGRARACAGRTRSETHVIRAGGPRADWPTLLAEVRSNPRLILARADEQPGSTLNQRSYKFQPSAFGGAAAFSFPRDGNAPSAALGPRGANPSPKGLGWYDAADAENGRAADGHVPPGGESEFRMESPWGRAESGSLGLRGALE